MHGSPIHANQVILPSVLTLLHANPTTAATATNIAVHVPWLEMEFKPIDIPSIPEPTTNI
jgi:hypothetical protein